MEHSYKFAILQAVPDPRRGERVNIGVAVFHADRLDLRFGELQKLRSLTGREWEKYVASYSIRAEQVSKLYGSDAERLAALAALERVITPTSFGWLEASNADEYEARVKDIMGSFVAKAISDRKQREPRINTEIALDFRKYKILAKGAEDLLSHKVVRNLEFEKHKGLRADFVLKNGMYHVTATLDLRKTNVRIDEACLKAVVLDKADDEFAGEKRLFGVYALVSTDAGNFKDHIGLLRDYADEVFNWMDVDERRKYQRRMFDALDRSFGSY